MTPATQARGGVTATWTRERIIEKIQRWVSLYGDVPRAADWNPSAAKWSGAEWRTERYRQGDPETGEAWPSLNATKRLFDGSLTAAVVAAGFEPTKPGPPSRRQVAAPELADRMVMSPEARVALDAARAEVEALAEKLGVRDRQIDRMRDRIDRLLAEGAKPARREKPRVETRTKTKTITRTKTVRVADDAAIARARKSAEKAVARAEQARDAAVAAADTARAEAKEARTTATRLAARLERAEATVNTLRDERRTLKSERDRAEDRAAAAERELEAERERAPAEPEVREVVVEREVLSASAVEVAAARKRVHEAELRAAAAERREREIAAAVTGERRMLTQAEVKELRKGGPSGEKVLGAALKSLASARRQGGKVVLHTALTEIASAAVRWRESL